METHLSRLPPPNAAIVLHVVELECFRDQFGMQACLLRGVGPRRRKLGPIGDDPKSFFPDADSLAVDQSRQLLAGICKACEYAHCKMKLWGMG